MAINFPNSPILNQTFTDSKSGFTFQWNGSVWKSFSASTAAAGKIEALDDISGSFNGITTSFPLTSNSVSLTPTSSASIVINLGGVIQDPTDDYSVLASNIVFSTPPINGLTFSGIALGYVLPNTVLTIADGATTEGSLNVASELTASRLKVTGISTLGNTIVGGATTQLIVNGNARITGILTIGTSSLTFDGVNNQINIGSGVLITESGTASFNDGINVSGAVTATTFVGPLTGTATSVAANSVGLGTHTYGDYVSYITGTSNQITVTSGTGEGSTPTLSIPNQFTTPQDVTVIRDLQVNRNLNVDGNITIGGSTATLFTTELKIFDPDIVLGFRTDANNNDVSNDNTANHGGVALASTEGTPLVSLFIAGIETTPPTYKKIMWFKSGTFAGLNTDAWLSNYAVGIGSTQFPNGVRLAAGSVQFTETDLAVVGNINSSGIITCTDINSTSDAKLKTNVHTVENALNVVSNLRGVSFDWKKSGKSSYGVIAQELEAVLPDLVSDTDPKTVNYNGLIGILIEGMKSQQNKINELEAEIKFLKGR